MAITYLSGGRIQGSSESGSTDTLGSAADATNSGAVVDDATAIYGQKSLIFTSDTVNLGNDLDAITSEFTFTCWAYFASATASGHKTIISKPAAANWTGDLYHSFTVQHSSGSTNVELVVNDGTTYQAITVASGGVGWHFITVTKTGNVFVLKVDDNLSATMEYSVTWGTQDWVIGETPFESSSRYWDGKIQDVAFWSRVLTGAEQTALFTNNATPAVDYVNSASTTSTNTGKVATEISLTGLKAYYTFNDATIGVTNSAGWSDKATLVTAIAASSPDFDEDYGTPTYTWTQTGSNITVTGGFAYMNDGGSTDGHRITAPLGVTLSDSTWVADFEYKAGATTRNLAPFILTAGTSIFRTSTQDCIGVREKNGSPEGLTIVSKDGSGSLTSTPEGDSVPCVINTWYYCRLKRTASDGSDNVRLDVYTTEALRTAGGNGDQGYETKTVASTVGGLTTIQHAGDAGGGASSGRTYWIDNTKIYNSISTVASASSSSNLPTGTRFEETNTRKIFRIKDGAWVEKGTA